MQTQTSEAPSSASFLAEASKRLAMTFDLQAAVRCMTELSVPELGTASLVFLLEDEQTLTHLAAKHVDPRRELPCKGLVALHLNHIDQVERAVSNPGGVQRRAQGRLRGLGLRPQSLEDEPTLFILRRESLRARQVRLLPQHHQERRRLASGLPGEHAGIELRLSGEGRKKKDKSREGQEDREFPLHQPGILAARLSFRADRANGDRGVMPSRAGVKMPPFCM